jgi:hypothetical protein
MASKDPDFEAKAADIIALYLHPPQHAAVFCVDEKTAIQALDRLDSMLPLSPGRENGMASSTTAMERYRYMWLWTYCCSVHRWCWLKKLQARQARSIRTPTRAPRNSLITQARNKQRTDKGHL